MRWAWATTVPNCPLETSVVHSHFAFSGSSEADEAALTRRRGTPTEEGPRASGASCVGGGAADEGGRGAFAPLACSLIA